MTEAELVEEEDTRALMIAAPNGVRVKELTPAQVIEQAKERAMAVADIIRKQHLSTRIGNKEYVQAEGWITLAAQHNLVPSVEWSRPVAGGGFESQAALRRMDNGVVVATAQAEAGTEGDGDWPTRASYAQRSMSETRAVSKVCRVALSWVMVLAGYQPTPAEEVPRDGFDDKPAQRGATTKGQEGERVITLRQRGVCVDCGQPVEAGEQARWNPEQRGKVKHAHACLGEEVVREPA